VAAGTSVRVSRDGGQSFRTADTGSLEMYVTDLVQVGDAYYAATGSFTMDGFPKGGRGVLRSTDGGMSWHNVSSGLQNTDVVSLAASADGRWLFAGTANGGVHRMALR
jgi:photosystem II stability/assembly factor-like uncharacterized protein